MFTKNRTTGKEQINPKLTNEIIESLENRSEKIVKNNEEEIEIINKKIAESQEQLATTSDENQKENIRQSID